MSEIRSTSHRTGNARRTIAHKLRARTHAVDPLSHDEDDYERDVPSMSLSKVFVVLLLLHVLVLFGMVVMHWSSKAGDSAGSGLITGSEANANSPTAEGQLDDGTVTATAAGEEADHPHPETHDPAVASTAEGSVPLSPPGQRQVRDIPAGWETTEVRSQEKMEAIATRVGVPKRWLLRANRDLGRLGESSEGVHTGMVLAVPPASVIEEWEIDERVGSRPNNPPNAATAAAPAAPTPPEVPPTVVTERTPEPPTRAAEPVVTAAQAPVREAARVADAARPTTPEPVEPELVTENNRPATAAAGSGRTHAVKSGETFYRIARQYNVSVDALMAANGYSNAGSLQVGTNLKIP